MGWGETFEDEVLAIVSVQTCLHKLQPADRVLIEMAFHIERPDDYDGPWPPTYSDIGRYVGETYAGRSMSEATVRYRRTEILSFLRGDRGPLRGIAPESPKIAESTSGTVSGRLTSKEGASMVMDTTLYETVYLPRYLDVIEAMATKLSNRDKDLYEDLRQTGMVALWRLDVSKASKNQDAWIRQAIRNRMIQHLRRVRPRDYKSLQQMLDDGDQVVKDVSTGEASFVDRFVGRRNYLEDEEQRD